MAERGPLSGTTIGDSNGRKYVTDDFLGAGALERYTELRIIFMLLSS